MSIENILAELVYSVYREFSGDDTSVYVDKRLFNTIKEKYKEKFKDDIEKYPEEWIVEEDDELLLLHYKPYYGCHTLTSNKERVNDVFAVLKIELI